ncbi:hypothetical protein H8S90_24090 [Olivibacter sp. SDN3]|uniref:hypothetical protein n=1 Tax=Olivibacter sp. SDN3 TaxID=2764720 RepID=UPI0016518E24|nr:hypothetical protein [Olivibacter sp. SDN3]QNL49752.1 hypothetical protein H8S90_24090 [Olivibacter sp. SDN3]
MNSFKSAIAPKIRRVIGSILFGSASLATNCFAQTPARAGVIAQGDSQQSKTVPLEKFSGYYQFPSKAGFIQFELKDNTLFAKQLWDNKEYQLIQIDETNFESKGEGHKVEFLKDNSGQFTHAKLLGRIITVKVGFDPKIIKQLSAAQLKRLEGTYILKDDSNLKLDILSSGTGLTIKQLWDNKEVAFTPRSETFFLNDDGTFPLTFLLSDGEAVQVTCFKDDIWLKAK